MSNLDFSEPGVWEFFFIILIFFLMWATSYSK